MIRALLLLPLLSTWAFAADVVFPPGSRIGLVPLDGMVVSSGMSGFIDQGTGMGIAFVEMPQDAFGRISAEFTDEALKAQGFTIRRRDEVQIGNAPALLVSGEQNSGGRAIPKSVLLVTDGTVTAMAVGQLPAGAPAENEERLRSILKTVALRPALGLDDQIAALPFTIGDRSGFRPLRIMAGNAILLTDGPNDVIRDVDQPIVIVARSLGAPPPPEQRASFAQSMLATNLLLKEIVPERAGGFRQGGDEWYEIVARAKDAPSGQNVVVSQTLRFEPGGYLRTVGIVRADQREVLMPRFRRVADAVAPR